MPLRFLHFRHVFLSLCALFLALSVTFTLPASAAQCPINQQPCPTAANPNRCISEQSICILEPLPGSSVTEITVAETGDLGAFFRYLNGGVWQWAFGVGIGAAVFGGVFAGLQIVLSNGDSGKIEAGKTRFLWATVGLLILLLAGVLLHFINPVGFQNV